MAWKSNNLPHLGQLLLVLLLLGCPALAAAVTPPIPAHPHQYVVDLAGVLDAGAQTRLNGLLRGLEDATTAQMVVLTVNSLEGQPIEEFSYRTAVKWGIGQKGKDNGVLLTVAVKDHKYRIEVGYGLEGVLPDSLAGSIGRQYLVPYFRKGDFAGGITATVTELVNIINNKDRVAKSEEPGPTVAAPAAVPPGQPEPSGPPALFLLIVLVILAVPALALILPRIFWSRKKGHTAPTTISWSSGSFSSSGSSGSGSSWGAGDGSGGGGSSGDFGGFGGDFGGGGVTGDW